MPITGVPSGRPRSRRRSVSTSGSFSIPFRMTRTLPGSSPSTSTMWRRSASDTVTNASASASDEQPVDGVVNAVALRAVLVRDDDRHACDASEHGRPHVRAELVAVEHVSRIVPQQPHQRSPVPEGATMAPIQARGSGRSPPRALPRGARGIRGLRRRSSRARRTRWVEPLAVEARRDRDCHALGAARQERVDERDDAQPFGPCHTFMVARNPASDPRPARACVRRGCIVRMRPYNEVSMLGKRHGCIDRREAGCTGRRPRL